MRFRKERKLLLIILGILLLIQLPWYFVVQAIVDKTQVKTVATVIAIGHEAANCTGDAYAQDGHDPTCDHSDRLYPIFSYVDQSGKKHVQSDQFFGEYKQDNPVGKLFGKKVGEKVTAYYSKNQPDKPLFMDSLLAYTAWLIPIFIAILVFVAYVALLIWGRFGPKSP